MRTLHSGVRMSAWLDAVYELFVFAYESNPKRSRFKSMELDNRAVWEGTGVDEGVHKRLRNLPHVTFIAGSMLRHDERFHKYGSWWGLAPVEDSK